MDPILLSAILPKKDCRRTGEAHLLSRLVAWVAREVAGLNEMKPGQELTYAFLSSKLRGVENF